MSEGKFVNNVKAESWVKHSISFLGMIILTSLAFYLVAYDVVPRSLVIPFIVLFAIIQVFLQLYTFMHLSQKGSRYYTVFILLGILIAVVSAIGIVVM